MVENQTVPAETARTAQLLEPFGPFGVQLPVGFLVLWFEDSDDLLLVKKIHFRSCESARTVASYDWNVTDLHDKPLSVLIQHHIVVDFTRFMALA